MIDLVLIHPNGRYGIYGNLSALAALEPPLWCAMLAAYVRRKGYSVAIIDAEAERLTPDAVAGAVEMLNPRLACVVAYGHQPSASTQVMPAAGATCSAIKALNDQRLVMLLGGHVAALPERTYREEQVDWACDGEGPVALERALAAITRPTSMVGLSLVSAPTPLVEDLDGEMPEPAWDLLPMHLYTAHNWHCLGGKSRAGYASLYTTLGCPFSCSFCCIQAPFKTGEGIRDRGGNSYRRWSPARVGENLENITRLGVRNVKIADEMFVLNRAHVDGVCDEILRRRLDLNLWAYARTDTVKDGMPEKLKAAGFNWLAFGIESGSAAVRDGSNKELAEAQIHETLAKVRAAGIHVIGNFIFGLPGETRESMQETLDLATELNCEFGNFYCAMAYPGSPLYTETLETRPQDLPRSWAGYSQHGLSTHPLRTETLSAREIVAFRDDAFLSYHSSARYQAMIASTFGDEGRAEIDRIVRAGRPDREAV